MLILSPQSFSEVTWDDVFDRLDKQDNPETGTASYTDADLPKADAIKKAGEFIQQEVDALEKEEKEKDGS
jgi:hypothetical protein